MQKLHDTESKEARDKAADQLGFIKGLNILFVTFFTFLGVIVLGFCIVNYLGYEELRDKHDALASQASVNFAFNNGQEEILFRSNERLFNLQNYVDELVSRRVNEILSNQTEFVNAVNQVVADHGRNVQMALNAQGMKIRADTSAEINSNKQEYNVFLEQMLKSSASGTVEQIRTLAPGLMREELKNFRQTEVNSIEIAKVFSFKNSAQNDVLNIRAGKQSVSLDTLDSAAPVPLIINADKLGVNVDTPLYSVHSKGKVFSEEDVCTKVGCLNAIDTNYPFKKVDGSITSQDSNNILRISSSGNVLISDDAAEIVTSKLQVKGKITASEDVCVGTNCLKHAFIVAASIGSVNDGAAIASTDSAKTLRIIGGQVTINSVNMMAVPTAALDVNGNVKATQFCIGSSCLTASNIAPSFSNSGTVISSLIGGVSITSAGNVGLGTSTPAEKLDVKGKVLSTDGFCLPGSTETYCLSVSSESLVLSTVSDPSNANNFMIKTYKNPNRRNTLYGAHEIAAINDNVYNPGTPCKALGIGLSFYQYNVIYCDVKDDKWKYVRGDY